MQIKANPYKLMHMHANQQKPIQVGKFRPSRVSSRVLLSPRACSTCVSMPLRRCSDAAPRKGRASRASARRREEPEETRGGLILPISMDFNGFALICTDLL